MPSPFPGMDPYIESSGLWGDFHGTLTAAVRGELNACLPDRYVASIELYLWAYDPDTERRTARKRPDVYVAEQSAEQARAEKPAALTAPATIVLPAAERRGQKYVQITDVEFQRVVTVIEFLSPANKEAGPDRDAFLAKRSEHLASRLNVVEVDLLRGGKRLPLGDPPPEMKDYYVMVCREWELPKAGFWTFGIRDPLPDIPVPLDADVPDVVLRLRRCVDRVYDEGRYYRKLQYDQPVKPRLNRRDAAWAAKCLASKPSAEAD